MKISLFYINVKCDSFFLNITAYLHKMNKTSSAEYQF